MKENEKQREEDRQRGDDAVDQNEKGEEGSVGVHVGAGQRKSGWEEFR